MNISQLCPGAFVIPERLPILEWAAARHELPQDTAMPGPFVPLPYQAEILRAFDDPKTKQVTIVAASQVGKSALLGVLLHHATTHDPGPTMWILPDIPVRNRWVQSGFKPAVDGCAHWRRELRSGKRSIALERARFKRSTIHFAIPTTSRLAQLSIRYVFIDEFDKLPDRTDGEGTPLNQARARQRWFPNGRMVLASTPRESPSPIWAELGASDWREIYVTCPRCGGAFWWDFRKVARWEERRDGTTPEQHAMGIRSGELQCWFECPECHGRIDDTERADMNNAQVARPTRKGEPGNFGFHVPSLASPLVSLRELVARWIIALSQLAAGEESEMRHMVQHELGEPYVANINSADEAAILALANGAKRGTVPDIGGDVYVSLGVDVQRDGIFWVAVAGNTESKRYAVIDWGEMLGEVEAPDFQDRFRAQLVGRQFEYRDGKKAKADIVFVDSGDGFLTSDIYRLCQESGARVFPTKGLDYLPGDRTAWALSDRSEPGGHGGRLVKIGTVAIKDRLARHFMRQPGHESQFMFPPELAESKEMLAHMTSEERVLSAGKWHWQPRAAKRANHWWDALVYGVAAQSFLVANLQPKRPRPQKLPTIRQQQTEIQSY